MAAVVAAAVVLAGWLIRPDPPAVQLNAIHHPDGSIELLGGVEG